VSATELAPRVRTALLAGGVARREPPPWRRVVAIVLPVVAFGVLAAIVVTRRDVFAAALDSAPVPVPGTT
jgi:hypothetical protein